VACSVLFRQVDVFFWVIEDRSRGVFVSVRLALMLKVPREISVVGFDDLPAGRRPAYLLTTVSQPFEAMANLAASMLRAQVDDADLPVQAELLRASLVERGSAQLLIDHSG